jgi:hypothetical protein
MRDVITRMSNPIPPFEELPELTLSLRSFGSRRRGPNEDALDDEQARFFAPMLDARRAATGAVTRAQVVAAFDARRLGALVDATLRAFAAERFQTRPPARRAFEAELFELTEPLRAAIRELRDLAEFVVAAHEPAMEYHEFTRWLGQLRVTFRAADAIWPGLGDALIATRRTEPAKRRKETR